MTMRHDRYSEGRGIWVEAALRQAHLDGVLSDVVNRILADGREEKHSDDELIDMVRDLRRERQTSSESDRSFHMIIGDTRKDI